MKKDFFKTSLRAACVRETARLMILLLCGAALCSNARAQNPAGNLPLEITAEKTLEWHRNDNLFIAEGKAVAKQGGTAVAGETLKADYRSGEGEQDIDIYRLSALGNVRIVSDGNTASGDLGVYDIDKGTAVLTGKNLRLVSPGQTITARERFLYEVTDGRFTAVGDARITRGEDTLEADTVTAFFSERGGERRLERIEADGNVVITTPAEVLTGDEGVYSAATNTAQITGNVKITRGPNILEGERGEVDLSTNVSRLFGSSAPGETGRVRGVFYPESEEGTK